MEGSPSEEERIAEDKKKGIDEAEEIPELVPLDPERVDEARNQAGPSRPSTPRPGAHKSPLPSGSPESEGKKLKPTVEKPSHEVDVVTPDPKRTKVTLEENVERRVEATWVDDTEYYHKDKVIGEEELWALEQEEQENEGDGNDLPSALWSTAALDRVPPDPPSWIEDLADEVEVKRLQRLGVLQPMEGLREGFKKLTTRS